MIVSLVVPFAVTVHRYRAAERERRAQIRWLMWAALVDLIVLVVPLENPPAVSALLFALSIALTSAAIVVAVTKHHLYAVDRLLSATFLYGVLAVLVVGVDLAVFAVAGGVLGERDAALVAIAVVAVVYAPLRSRLWQWVRRLVRGSRDDPYATMSALAERLESAADPDEQLRAVVRTVAEAFRLPYVRVEIERSGGGLAIVEHGREAGPTHALSVGYRGEPIGRLVFCPGGGTALSERDQRLLGDLVRQAAAAARASELSTELQQGRCAWSRLARRNADGCVATCTTASARASERWHCASRPRGTCQVRAGRGGSHAGSGDHGGRRGAGRRTPVGS